jgi:hypothetical protein
MRKFLMLALTLIVVAGALSACPAKEVPMYHDYRGGRDSVD